MHNKIIDVSSLCELSKYNIDKVVVAIGFFDGMHLGHQKVISKLLSLSKKYNATPVVITFYPHPRKVIHGDSISIIMSKEEKLKCLSGLDVKALVTVPFTKELSSMSPENFICSIVDCKDIKLEAICVGSKWRFGNKGVGDKALLEQLSISHKFEFCPVDEYVKDGLIISSTRIRALIKEGKTEEVKKLR